MAGKAPFPGGREKVVERLEETKPGGVLVHCQAGMSRSATVTAAYLMVALDIGPEEAVEMIKEKRPVIEYVPSPFLIHILIVPQSFGNIQIPTWTILQYEWEGIAPGQVDEAVLYGKDDKSIHQCAQLFSSMRGTVLIYLLDGDGGAPPMDKMAKYPATPTPSNPPTPSGGHGRRKIRCKACR